MGSGGVVPGAELVQEFLKFGGGVWERSGGEPAFEGLMEAFDFALGLWVAWCPVLLVDVVGF